MDSVDDAAALGRFTLVLKNCHENFVPVVWDSSAFWPSSCEERKMLSQIR